MMRALSRPHPGPRAGRRLRRQGGRARRGHALRQRSRISTAPGSSGWPRVTPAQVRAAMQRWLTPAGLALRVDPGPREAYEEARRSVRPRRAGWRRRVAPSQRPRYYTPPQPRRPAARAAALRAARADAAGQRQRRARFPGDRARPPLERHPAHLCAPQRRAGDPGRGRVQRRHRRRSRQTGSAPRR